MIPRAVALDGTRARVQRRSADFVMLTKPRVVLMVLVTIAVGHHLAAAGGPDPLRFLHLLLGTALAAGGTLALNQYLERDVDGRMERTRRRPLPAGRLLPWEALAFGTALLAAGTLYLAVAVNLLSGLVTAVTAVSYLCGYTPLKRCSSLCLVVGAIPGALPPVTGWAAARGEIGWGAGVLFAILFLWQLPHTLAIASVYRGDYARAGLCVLPSIDQRGGWVGTQVVVSCVALFAAGLLPSATGMTGNLYFLGALGLGLVLLGCAVAMARSRAAADARRLMFMSLVYLPSLFVLMALDKLPT